MSLRPADLAKRAAAAARARDGRAGDAARARHRLDRGLVRAAARRSGSRGGPAGASASRPRARTVRLAEELGVPLRTLDEVDADRPDGGRRRRDRPRPEPDQGRRRGAAAGEDRRGGERAAGGHRRRGQARGAARGLSAAGRDRALRLDGDAARGRGGCSATADVDGRRGRRCAWTGTRRWSPTRGTTSSTCISAGSAIRAALAAALNADPGRGRARALHRHGASGR